MATRISYIKGVFWNGEAWATDLFADQDAIRWCKVANREKWPPGIGKPVFIRHQTKDGHIAIIADGRLLRVMQHMAPSSDAEV